MPCRVTFTNGGQDPVAAAVGAAAKARPPAHSPALLPFILFDPAKKSSAAAIRQAAGTVWRVVKGAYAMVAKLAPAEAAADGQRAQLQGRGFRVLAVVDVVPASEGRLIRLAARVKLASGMA